MKRSLLTFCCGAALTAGWFAGKSGEQASAPAAQPAPLEVRTASGSATGHGGLSALLADPSPDALALLAARISNLGPDEIVEQLRGLDQHGARSFGPEHLAAEALIERLVSLDPEKALRLLTSFRSLDLLLAESLGRAAAGRDAATAQRWAGMMRTQDDSDRAQSFWEAFGANAAPSAYASLPENSDGAKAAQWNFVNQWMGKDTAACAAWAATRPKAWEAAASAMAQKDPQGALAWIESLSGKGSRAAARSRVYGEWAARDPLAAFAASQEDGAPDAHQSSEPVGRSLADLPLETVIPAAATAPSVPAIRCWLCTSCDRDPQAVAGALSKMPDSAARREFVRSAAERWRESGSEEARAAMSTLFEAEPPGSLRNLVGKAYIECTANSGETEAAFDLLEKVIPAAERDDVMRRLAEAVFHRDPAALAANLERIPLAARPPRRAMLDLWNQLDPVAAKAWAAAHPE